MPKTLTKEKTLKVAARKKTPVQPIPIWEKIQRRAQQVSADELAQLPPDGAAEHDHYLYGTPKRSDS